jgi:hypothetical protein
MKIHYLHLHHLRKLLMKKLNLIRYYTLGDDKENLNQQLLQHLL